MIPKIFNQAWFGETPYPYGDWLVELADLHPGWQINTWNERNIPREKLHPNTIEVINTQGICENYKSDIFRWDIERVIGGIYADADFEFFKCFDPLLGHECFCGESYPGHPQCALFGTIPNGEWVKNVFNAVLEKFDTLTIRELSEPPAVSFNMTKEIKKCDKIYEPKIFQLGYRVWPESYSRHHWMGSQGGWYSKLNKKV
jgi:mannosyltransferase OCH1-like enzyme